MNNPLFSILMANYNNGQYIGQAIESVIEQAYSNWEIIIVDDCSKDSSVEVLSKYCLKDERIKFFINKKNKGVGYTKNRAACLANGEILGFLDSDDTIVSNALEIMVKEHRKNSKCSLIYSTHYICDKNLEIIKLCSDIRMLDENEFYLTCKNKIHCIGHFATFKKQMYLKNKPLDINLKKAIDQDLYLKLEEVGKVKYLDIPLYYYRHHDNSISLNNNGWKAFLWEVRAKEKAYLRRLNTNVPNISKEKLNHEYYYVYKQLAFECLNDKKFFKYLGYCWLFLCTFHNPLTLIKFMYYTIKRHFYPEYFKQ